VRLPNRPDARENFACHIGFTMSCQNVMLARIFSLPYWHENNLALLIFCGKKF
jgi:hypothetical protein